MKITNYKFIKSQSSFNCSRIVDGGRSDANFNILMRCTKKNLNNIRICNYDLH